MLFAEALQKVYDLALKSAATPEDQEALDVYHDFIVNCPWLEEDETE